MMLAAIPGSVGDGGTRDDHQHRYGATTATHVTTRVGEAPGTTLRRFLVGPKECEITGIHSTPDGRSLFVNIQHPGENGSPRNITSNWPAEPDRRRRAGASARARRRSSSPRTTAASSASSRGRAVRFRSRPERVSPAPMATQAIPAPTPMMAQYLALKAEAGDCLLFYRMGDFFELFFDDAGSPPPCLDIALTARGEHDGRQIPMCGVPVHAAKPISPG